MYKQAVLSIIFLSLIFTSCSDNSITGNKRPPLGKYIFEVGLVNVDYEDYFDISGIYIDNVGDVYGYRLHYEGVMRWEDALDGEYSESTLERKFEYENNLFETVDMEDLNHYLDLINEAIEGTTVVSEADTSTIATIYYRCYLFNEATKIYTEHLLKTELSHNSENTSPAAKQIVAWLKQLAGE